jgi:hypothetical protein
VIGPDAQQQRQGSLQPGEADAAARVMASMRLARLRVHAGLARGDELAVCAGIEKDAALSIHDIEREIAVLEQVQRSAPPRRPQPGRGIPRTAQRSGPSLASQPAPAMAMTAAAGAPELEDNGEDIFLS